MRLSDEHIKERLNSSKTYILFDVTVYCYCQGKETYFYERFISEDGSKLHFVTTHERFSIDAVFTEHVTYDEASTLFGLGVASLISPDVEYYDVYRDDEVDAKEVETLDECDIWKATA